MTSNPSSIPHRAKSPLQAALLSLIVPGLGQIYCQQDNKGVLLLGLSLLGHWSTNGTSSWILWPAMALDAWLIAKKINTCAAVQRWEFFPGIKFLNSLPPRLILLSVILLIATLTVIHIVRFASDYSLPGRMNS